MTSYTSLPIAQIVFESAWRAWRLRSSLVRIMLLPALAIGALTYFAVRQDAPPNAPANWIVYFVRGLVLAIAAVSCHRLILIGPESVPRFGSGGMTSRDWKFVLLFAAISIVATAASLIAGAIASVVLSIPINVFDWKQDALITSLIMACAIMGGAYALARLSLMLPARAIDRPIGFRAALALSKGNEWRLIVLVSLLPWLVNEWERSLARTFESVAGQWMMATALYLLFLPFEIALLSVSYRELRNRGTAD